jgi:hypothetical protein
VLYPPIWTPGLIGLSGKLQRNDDTESPSGSLDHCVTAVNLCARQRRRAELLRLARQ